VIKPGASRIATNILFRLLKHRLLTLRSQQTRSVRPGHYSQARRSTTIGSVGTKNKPLILGNKMSASPSRI